MEFAGWQVPLQYTSIVKEHEAVRQRVGVFDVSHMGKFVVRGKGAQEFLDRILSNGLHKISPGRALYSLLLNDEGGVVDDVIVYEMDGTDFFVVVNAATREKDFRWFENHRPRGVDLVDESPLKVILAVQGPASEELLQRVLGVDLRDLKPFHFRILRVFGGEILVAATGYTGERGFEIIALREEASEIFGKVLAAGKDVGLLACGFGARDTLRLEAKYLLYGQDMDDQVTPLEATLGWVCDFSKDFVGKKSLVRQMEEGISKRLVGFEVRANGVARHGHQVLKGDRPVGVVTSGTFSPTLQKPIGLAYVPADEAEVGTPLAVRVRDRLLPIKVVKTPFYKSPALERTHDR